MQMNVVYLTGFVGHTEVFLLLGYCLTYLLMNIDLHFQ